MFQNLEVFDLASRRAAHSAHRQSVIARNIANADTPGFRGQDVKKFSAHFGAAQTLGLRQTQLGHLHDVASSNFDVMNRDTDYIEPNGNTVSLETETLFADQVRRNHKKAISVYKASMDILRRVVG